MAGANNPTTTRTVAAHVSGRARVYDDTGVIAIEELPVLSISAEFYANAFPSARIVIPVGKSAGSAAAESVVKARTLADNLKTFRRIDVAVTLSGEYAPSVQWPSKEIRVFNGYVTGTSTARSGGTVNVVVSATHWLMDLDASSTLSSQFVKGSPVAIALPAVGNGYRTYSSSPYDPDLVDMSDDVWLQGLKPKFIRLCDNATLVAELECATSGTDVQALQNDGDSAVNLSNDIAKPRINGSVVGSFDDSSVVDVPHLSFFDELDSALDGALTQAVSESLFNATAGNSSIWDQLLSIARQLHFSVIPTIDSAVCAPLAPCLAGEDPPRHVTIKANEYWSAQPDEGVFRLYRGLSLHGQWTSPWNSFSAEDVENGVYFPSDGCYIAEQDEELDDDVKYLTSRGAIVYDRAPSWLDDKSMRAVLMRNDTNPDKNPTTTMQDADSDEETRIDQLPLDTTPKRDDALAKRIGDAYAKWRYWNDTLMGRTGQITGKLRFDISPGTIVRIEDIDGKLYDDPAEFGYLYAQVTGVQFVINTQNRQASTTLTLSHIRRESEKKMGTDGHPLYKDLWVGTVLQNVPMQSARTGTSETPFLPTPGNHELKPR